MGLSGSADSDARPTAEGLEPADPYRLVPYHGGALAASHPDVLRFVGRRAGIHTARSSDARVLEIGCAEAANLIPIAYRLEGARCVGLDASAAQLEVARAAKDRLGLDNLELVEGRIEDISSDELGEFDYVICHGVLSWVSPEIQRRLWVLLSKVLAPDGVALVSFNCAPGWCVRDEIRRAILARTKNAKGSEQIHRAREVLALFAGTSTAVTPYSAILAEESRRVLMRSDAYIAHEYLERDLHSFRYGEIADAAQGVGLRPLDELGRALPDRRMEEDLLARLKETVGDDREAEELCESMLFRAFRLLTLGRAAAGEERGASPIAEELFWSGRLQPEERRLSLDPSVSESFIAAEGERIASSDPLLKGALLELTRAWPAALSWEDLTARVRALLELRRVPAEHATDARLAVLRSDLLELWRLGYLLARSTPLRAVARSEAPRVSALTRWEAERGPTVSGPFHQTITLDSLTRGLVRRLDGSTLGAGLLTEAQALVSRGEVVLLGDDGEPLEPNAIDEALPELVQHAIASLAEAGLLER